MRASGHLTFSEKRLNKNEPHRSGQAAPSLNNFEKRPVVLGISLSMLANRPCRSAEQGILERERERPEGNRLRNPSGLTSIP